MKKLSIAVLSIMCLALVAGTALADRQVTVTPVTGDAIPFNMGITPSGADGVCQMGNLNPIAWALTDWVWGAEKYKYLYYADPALCTVCSDGFTVEAVTLYLQFGPEDIPVGGATSFEARVDFEEAIWDVDLQCWYPGPEICVSPVYTITIDTPGLYAISLPMDPAACACAHFGYWYGISFEFITAFASGMEPDIVTDDFPVGCVSWNDYGMGWIDTQDFGFPGEISMVADIVCCSNPVQAEKSTWGDIKAMFR